MSLSIIIPSHNPETIFFLKLAEVLRDHPDWQAIVVDDASDHDLRDLLPAAANLTVLRQPVSRGAGAARNLAMAHVTGTYTVFLDDDDFMDWSVVEQLMAMMTAQPAIDMAVSAYRFLQNGVIRQAYKQDMRILLKTLNHADTRVVGLDGNEDLLRLMNFPWTKLYRSDFLRRIGLRFSETTVQNDIHAHWQSLLGASRILVTSLVQCTKTDNTRGTRISNTADHRRLQAFTALHETYALVRASRRPQVEAAFWTFYEDLVRWMLNVARPDARLALMRAHLSFAAVMPPDLQIEDQTGTKRWEIWDMNHIADLMTTEADGIAAPGRDHAPDLLLAEISRLKHLATELRRDNDRLRADLRHRDGELRQRESDLRQRSGEIDRLGRDIAGLRREVDSKAAQMAIRIRTFYRGIIPGRRRHQG